MLSDMIGRFNSVINVSIGVPTYYMLDAVFFASVMQMGGQRHIFEGPLQVRLVFQLVRHCRYHNKALHY